MNKTENELSEMVEELFFSWSEAFHGDELYCKSDYSDFRSDGDAWLSFLKWVEAQL